MTVTVTAAAPRRAAPSAALRLGAVDLTVRELDPAVAWYERVLGLRVHDRGDDTASLGDGTQVTGDVSPRPTTGPVPGSTVRSCC